MILPRNTHDKCIIDVKMNWEMKSMSASEKDTMGQPAVRFSMTKRREPAKRESGVKMVFDIL